MRKSFVPLSIALPLVSLLAACGSGGGGSSMVAQDASAQQPPAQQTPTQQPPAQQPPPQITVARDPGVRPGAAGAGSPMAGLSATQTTFFHAGSDDFAEAEEVADGLGPRMNLDGCGGCHIQPALGGSSPALNPQVAFARKNGGTDSVPSFLRADGPVREARFVKNADGTPDGGVHALFTINGRT